MLPIAFALQLASAHVFSFPGGSDRELVDAIAKASGRPAVVLSDDPLVKRAAIRFEWTDDSDFLKKLGRIRDCHLGDSEVLGISQGRWPEGAFYRQTSSRMEYLQRLAALNGRVEVDRDRETYSIRTLNGPVSVDAFIKALTGKSITTHWFFSTLFVSVSAERADLATILKSLCGAIGGKLVEREGGYSLEFDPGAHRRRSLSLFSSLQRKETNPVLRADRQYEFEVYRKLSDAQIRQAYKGETSEITVGLDPVMLLAARNRLDVRFALVENGKGTPSARQTYSWIMENADFSKPGLAVVDAQGRVKTRLKCKKPNSGVDF